MGLKQTREAKIYASVLADGLIHVTVPEGTPGSVVREYETSDGAKGTKTEMVYNELSGIISSVAFYDGDFGKTLQITIEDADGGKPIMLSLNTSVGYGEDVMKKLPNVDVNKEVVFVPYSFTDDKGKNRKGVTILQDDKKIQNYYYDAEKKENINGYPVPPRPKKGKELSKDEWKMYFMQARLFLIEQTEETFKHLMTPSETVDTMGDVEF